MKRIIIVAFLVIFIAPMTCFSEQTSKERLTLLVEKECGYITDKPVYEECTKAVFNLVDTIETGLNTLDSIKREYEKKKEWDSYPENFRERETLSNRALDFLEQK